MYVVRRPHACASIWVTLPFLRLVEDPIEAASHPVKSRCLKLLVYRERNIGLVEVDSMCGRIIRPNGWI